MKSHLAFMLTMLLTVFAHGQEPTTETPQQPLTRDFDTLDRDGDGYITRWEAENENVEYHFDAIDEDKNGVLGRDEFVNYIAEEDPLLGEPLPLSELPQAELRERIEGDPNVVSNPELLAKINSDFESLDENNNRYLTREEVENEAVHEHFSHMDLNSDGHVTEREYNAYLRDYGTQVATEDIVEQLFR